MAFDPGAISSTLTAAVGDEPGLIAELKLALMASADGALAALAAADGPREWTLAASRLKGLCASFGAVRLMALAEEAERIGRPDAVLLRKIRRAIARL